MIFLDKVSKSYGSQEIFKDFSLKIAKGEKVAIMGRSGAGKTTLIGLITGLIKPDSGRAEVSKDIRFGVVFQEDRLVEPLSAKANCRLVTDKNRDPKPLLSRLGITDELSGKPVKELSGGERRRVAIARAILAESDAVILDEPFKGIDSATLPAVIREVNESTLGKALILVTHSKDEAEALGCKIVNI